MQHHSKELLKDLSEINYPNKLAKLKTQFTGKVWNEKFKEIKDQLNKLKDLNEERDELQQVVLEKKKRILQLEKELKDKQSIKELYEKRIGELQLRLEQSICIEN